MLLFLLLGCDDDDDVYESCSEAEDCEAPEGAAGVCIDRAGGFCTWECAEDADCEDQVCASFESEPAMYCFPECGDEDECPDGFGCRSTGGGSDNRKVCYPEE